MAPLGALKKIQAGKVARHESKPGMNPIPFLRKITFIEGISYLLLLFVAMPLKYIWDMPQAVRIVGMLHGILFVIFCFSLLHTTIVAKWPLARAALVFLASIVPFGPWLIDQRLTRFDREFVEARGAITSPGR